MQKILSRLRAVLAQAPCSEGCYKHFDEATRTWVCCRCGN